MISPTVSEQAFLQIPEEERSAILSIGVAMRLSQLKERLFLAEAKIRGFEEKYHAPLASFDVQGLSDTASPEEHEDFILWHHWTERAQETRTTIQSLQDLAPQVI